MWAQYLKAPDRETMRKDTMTQLIADKGELIRVIEALEADDLIMYAAEDS